MLELYPGITPKELEELIAAWKWKIIMIQINYHFPKEIDPIEVKPKAIPWIKYALETLEKRVSKMKAPEGHRCSGGYVEELLRKVKEANDDVSRKAARVEVAKYLIYHADGILHLISADVRKELFEAARLLYNENSN